MCIIYHISPSVNGPNTAPDEFSLHSQYWIPYDVISSKVLPSTSNYMHSPRSLKQGDHEFTFCSNAYLHSPLLSMMTEALRMDKCYTTNKVDPKWVATVNFLFLFIHFNINTTVYWNNETDSSEENNILPNYLKWHYHKRETYKILVRKPEGRHHLVDLGIDGTISEWNLKY